MFHRTEERSPTFAAGRRVLVSGASIAGPALAYWLDRYGFSVTVIERSSEVRPGGYPIDLRGAAMTVAEAMGIRPALLAEHIRSRRATFLDGEGDTIAVVAPELIHGSVPGRDVELPRGKLATLLASLTGGRVTYRFDTSIVDLTEDETGMEVVFSDGGHERFDIVIGADGVHSHTRALTFGAEAHFARSIGYSFAGFSTPNRLSLSHEAIIVNAPGRMAALYAVGDKPAAFFTLLAFAHAGSLDNGARDPAVQREITASAFADLRWEIPWLIDAMRDADDLYLDTVEQIVMPAWSKGRVALVGDAAYAPSFLTGQGTSLALVGAFVLASELASHRDHVDAFAAYDRRLRPYVELNQATVEQGKAGMIPSTPEQMEARKAGLRQLIGTRAEECVGRPEHIALDLSAYDDLLSATSTARPVRS